MSKFPLKDVKPNCLSIVSGWYSNAADIRTLIYREQDEN